VKKLLTDHDEGKVLRLRGEPMWGFSLPLHSLNRAALLLSTIYMMIQAIFCLENGFCS